MTDVLAQAASLVGDLAATLHAAIPAFADLPDLPGLHGLSDMRTLGAVSAAALAAGFTQGFAGFGSTVIALPLLVAVLGMRVAVPLGCLMALAINVVLVGRMFGHVRRGPLTVLLLTSLPGMVVGGRLLSVAPEAWLEGLLGAMVLAFTVFAARTASAADADGATAPALHVAGAPLRHVVTVAVGLVSGALGTAVGINGPPVVAWAMRQGWGRHAMKATLAGYFLLAGVGIVGAQGLHGELTGRVLLLFCAGLPALAAGLYGGHLCFGRLDEAAFRKVLLGLFAVSGAGLLWRAVGLG
uniref:Probable membrane transporter protein n=1 Tax=Nitratidesulfovibrio vulgaris (strain DSM 19637 / Miyazaki F) TaxID=883 RepID=B8DKE1_NITV9